MEYAIATLQILMASLCILTIIYILLCALILPMVALRSSQIEKRSAGFICLGVLILYGMCAWLWYFIIVHTNAQDAIIGIGAKLGMGATNEIAIREICILVGLAIAFPWITFGLKTKRDVLGANASRGRMAMLANPSVLRGIICSSIVFMILPDVAYNVIESMSWIGTDYGIYIIYAMFLICAIETALCAFPFRIENRFLSVLLSPPFRFTGVIFVWIALRPAFGWSLAPASVSIVGMIVTLVAWKSWAPTHRIASKQ